MVESVDFIGTTDGVAFTRQPQIRYSNNGFEVALENPETTVGTTTTAQITTDDNSVPDLIGTYTMKASWGHVKVGGILRQLAYETQGEDYSDTGIALSLSSRINLSNGDDIRIQVASGSGFSSLRWGNNCQVVCQVASSSSAIPLGIHSERAV